MTNTEISLKQNDPTTEMTLRYQFHKKNKSYLNLKFTPIEILLKLKCH